MTSKLTLRRLQLFMKTIYHNVVQCSTLDDVLMYRFSQPGLQKKIEF